MDNTLEGGGGGTGGGGGGSNFGTRPSDLLSGLVSEAEERATTRLEWLNRAFNSPPALGSSKDILLSEDALFWTGPEWCPCRGGLPITGPPTLGEEDSTC